MGRKLNDQWVEVIDGQKHMVKETKSENSKIVCPRCLFSDGHGTCNYPEDDCPVQNGYYIKDLGVLNDDGLLPCPFCGEYPVIQNAYDGANGADDSHGEWEVHCDADKHLAFSGVFKTKLQAIEDWNRRA